MFEHLKKTLTVAALAGALALPTLSFAQPAGAAQNKDKDDQAKAARKGKELHPVIRHSIRQLEAVKNELTTKAASDFGGHKAAAIKSIDEAIHHLHEALEYDKK